MNIIKDLSKHLEKANVTRLMSFRFSLFLITSAIMLLTIASRNHLYQPIIISLLEGLMLIFGGLTCWFTTKTFVKNNNLIDSDLSSEQVYKTYYKVLGSRTNNYVCLATTILSLTCYPQILSCFNNLITRHNLQAIPKNYGIFITFIIICAILTIFSQLTSLKICKIIEQEISGDKGFIKATKRENLCYIWLTVTIVILIIISEIFNLKAGITAPNSTKMLDNFYNL